MIAPELIDQFNQVIENRYFERNPLTLELNGHHPDFLAEFKGHEVYLHAYKLGSPNLIGSHPLRKLLTLEDSSLAYAFDGIGDHSNKLFASYTTDPQTLINIGRVAGVPMEITITR